MNTNANFKFQYLSEKLEKIKQKTYSVLDEFDKNETIAKLKSKLEQEKNRPEIRVAFVGQYNAGKSTIISALTNRNDIKIHSNVATDRSKEFDWNNIKIVDTPGILAGNVEKHDETTKETLSNSDIIVYVITSQLFDDIIFDNFIDLAYKQKLKDKMLIAINKMSMEKGDFDILKHNYTESLKTIFKEKDYDFDFDIVFMDAFDYLEGIEEEEEDLIEISNFISFIESLNKFIHNKGIIQKSFDTPLRIIKEEIDKIALDESDPSFNLVIKKYENRLLNHKKELIKEVNFLFDDLKDKILTEGYSISSLIGEISKEEFESKQQKFNKFLENETIKTKNEIEKIIFDRNKKLGEEITEIETDKEIKIYTQNLKNEFDNYKHDENYEASSLNNKINLLENVSNQAHGLSNYMGASKSASLLAKSGEISGSQGHNFVYEAGKVLGHNFKPWQAINIAKDIGNVAKFAGPAISVLTTGISLYGTVKEENKLKKITASKNQMNDSFFKISNKIIKELDVKFKEYLKNNIGKQLKEFEVQKAEIIRKNKANSSFLNKITKLNSEYIDFIEIVNE